MNETATSPSKTPPRDQPTRPLYIRRIPEPLWLRLHENALRNRVRLQTYLVKLLEAAATAGDHNSTDASHQYERT